MVFRKQLNEVGKYKDQSGQRWEILSCERTESIEWYDTGEVDEQGEPIWAQRVVINKGWDAFDSEEAAAQAYGLTLYEEQDAA
jgi:hypothetical protein